MNAETTWTEAESMMAWLERRVKWGHLSFPIHVRAFKSMWQEHFGTLDNIPQEFKDRMTQRHREMKANGRV